jgi:5'-nucleotidase
MAGIKNFKPDVVFSGINQGSNTGVSVFYSGTISAAREGFINRVPSVAISLCSGTYRDFSAAIAAARLLMDGYLNKVFPLDVMLNVNVPPLPVEKIKGMKLTKQAVSRFIEEFIPEKEHEDKKVFTLAGEIEVLDADGTSDEEAISEGYISVTPLKLDLTDYQAFPFFKDWVEKNNFKEPKTGRQPSKTK